MTFDAIALDTDLSIGAIFPRASAHLRAQTRDTGPSTASRQPWVGASPSSRSSLPRQPDARGEVGKPGVQQDHVDPGRPSRPRAHHAAPRDPHARTQPARRAAQPPGRARSAEDRSGARFSSLFSFCTDRLGLTKASAFRRTAAARLLARFPVIAEYLADGRLNLTTLVELRDVLDEAHATEILDRAAGRTEDQVKQLVAALRPQPAPPDLLRKLPTPRNDSSGSGPEPVPGGTAHQAEQLPIPASSLPPAAPTPPAASAQPGPAPVRPSAGTAASVQPIAPERHVLRITVGATFSPISRRFARRCRTSCRGPDWSRCCTSACASRWRAYRVAAAARARRPRRRRPRRAVDMSRPPSGTRCGRAMAANAPSWGARASDVPPGTDSKSTTSIPSPGADRRPRRT